MTDENFYFLLYNHLTLELFLVFSSILFGFILFKSRIYSLFDQMTFYVITSYAGFSVVIFLYILGYIKVFYLYSFILTELFFILGFLLVRPIRLPNKNNLKKDFLYNKLKINNEAIIVYYISVLLYLFANIFISVKSGGLIKPNGGTFVYFGGYGILFRISIICSKIIAVVLIYKFFLKKIKIIDILIFLILILFSFFSGSKVGLLVYLFILVYFWLFILVRYEIKINIKKILNILFISVLLASFFGFVMMDHETSFISVIRSILIRILDTGDIYFMAYPNSVISTINIEHGNFLSALFSHTLAGMKLISWNEVPHLVGEAVIENVYNIFNTKGAPNSRQNIFGLYYLGFWGSIPFSFILGLFAGFIRNKIIYIVPKSLNGIILFILLILPFPSLDVDPEFFTYQYTSIVFIFLPIFIISYIIVNSKKLHVKYINKAWDRSA